MNESLKPLVGLFTPEQLKNARPSQPNDCPFCGERCGALFTFDDCRCSTRLTLCGECLDDFYDNTPDSAERLFRCPGCEMNLYEHRLKGSPKPQRVTETDSPDRVTRQKTPAEMGNTTTTTIKEYLHPSRLTIDAEACRIGHYQTERFISKGSFGHVMLARRAGIEADEEPMYAVKVIYKEHRYPHSQETQILRDLVGIDGVVQYVEHFETDQDALVIVTKYEEGMVEMYDLLVQHPFCMEQANTIFNKLCTIMAAVHSKGIVHRDLKPENILVNPETNKVIIVDWGLAFYPANTTERKSCGSPNYAAPELVSGQDYDGPEVDVWSMGVVLYAMATGTLPFDATHIQELFRQIRACRVDYRNPRLYPKQVSAMKRIFVLRDRPTMQQLCGLLS